jgi:hypothetical protein
MQSNGGLVQKILIKILCKIIKCNINKNLLKLYFLKYKKYFKKQLLYYYSTVKQA